MNAPRKFQAVVDDNERLPAEPVSTDGVCLDEIAAALDQLRPSGSILLVWIDPMKSHREHGQIGAATFMMPGEGDAAVAWAAEHNHRRRNVYWTVNQTRRPMCKKASKTDMAAGIMLWADADPKVKELGDYAEARAELKDELLPVVRQTASIIIDSGNGLQVFWRLSEPFSLPDGLDAYEALNTRVGIAFDGPSTFSADHVMRLPGTLNYPSPAKLKKGYPSMPSRARLLLADGPSYTVEQIEGLIAGRALAQRLAQYLRARPQARARWRGGVEGLADTSHSAMLFSMVSMLRGKGGFTLDETKELVMSWAPGGPLHNAHDPDRDFKRCWDRCHAASGQPDSPIAGAGGEPAPKADSARATAAALSEDQLALSFVAQHGAWFRWTPGMDWMRNETTHWVRDDERRRFSVARKICRQAGMSVSGSDKKLARALSSAKTVAAVLTMAQADERVVLPVDAWDRDPMVLNTPGGAYDLETGKRLVSSTDLFTQIIAVAPDPTMKTPTWLRFLSEIFVNDLEMVEFIQRLCGYCLTGDRREQKLPFFYGTGANGKSVLIDELRATMGTYALNLPSEALMRQHYAAHPTELAQLRGKRLAISSELEDGAHWAESRIKGLTGDATLTARFMRQDFFEFKQTQKHIVVGNFKPRLKGDDPAIARRMVLVPFTEKFTGHRCDPLLAVQLAAERPGITAWMIDGARKWVRDGLRIPEKVRQASDEYLSANDDIGLWLEDCCVIGSLFKGPAAALYKSFAEWKEAAGERPQSMTAWGARMGQRFAKSRTAAFRGYDGVALRPSQASTSDAAQSYGNRRG